MKETIENLRQFKVGEKQVVKFNPRTDHKGYLELQAVEGAAIYLFRGSLSAAQCESALAEEFPNFDLAAAVGQAAQMKLEPSIGELTVFSKKESLGFVRICEYTC